MLSGVLANLASFAAQPQMLAIGSGMLAGAIAGTTLVVTGILPERPAPQLTLLECPDAGRAVARIDAGVSILVTARNPDGTWLELYVGVPGVDRGWAPASALRVDTAVETLPIVDCVVEPVSTLATLAPEPTPSTDVTSEPSAIATLLPTSSLAPGPSPAATPKVTATAPTAPTVSPLPPPPTIPPTLVPTSDLTPPSIDSFAVTSPGVALNGSYYIGGACYPPTATIEVSASDASGVASVTLYYRVDPYDPALSPLPLNSAPMNPIGGGAYEYELDPVNSWTEGEISMWVRATDSHGNITAYVPFGNPYLTTDVSLLWEPFCIT